MTGVRGLGLFVAVACGLGGQSIEAHLRVPTLVAVLAAYFGVPRALRVFRGWSQNAQAIVRVALVLVTVGFVVYSNQWDNADDEFDAFLAHFVVGDIAAMQPFFCESFRSSVSDWQLVYRNQITELGGRPVAGGVGRGQPKTAYGYVTFENGNHVLVHSPIAWSGFTPKLCPKGASLLSDLVRLEPGAKLDS